MPRESLEKKHFERIKKEIGTTLKVNKRKERMYGFADNHMKAISRMDGTKSEKEELLKKAFDPDFFEVNETYLENLDKLISQKHYLPEGKRNLTVNEAMNLLDDMHVHTNLNEQQSLFKQVMDMKGDLDSKKEVIHAIRESLKPNPKISSLLSSGIKLEEAAGIIKTIKHNWKHPFIKENEESLFKGEIEPREHSSAFKNILYAHYNPKEGNIKLNHTNKLNSFVKEFKKDGSTKPHEKIMDFINELKEKTLYLKGSPLISSFSLEVSDKLGRKYSVKGDGESFVFKRNEKEISPKKIKGLKKVLKAEITINHDNKEVKELLEEKGLFTQRRIEQNKKKISTYPKVIKDIFDEINRVTGLDPMKGEVEAPEIIFTNTGYASHYSSNENKIEFKLSKHQLTQDSESIPIATIGEEFWHWAHRQTHNWLLENNKMKKEIRSTTHHDTDEYIGRLGGLWASEVFNKPETIRERQDEEDYISTLCKDKAAVDLISKLESLRIGNRKPNDSKYLTNFLYDHFDLDYYYGKHRDEMPSNYVIENLQKAFDYGVIIDRYIKGYIDHRSQEFADEKFEKEFKGKSNSKLENYLKKLIYKPKKEVISILNKEFEKKGRKNLTEFSGYVELKKQDEIEKLRKYFEDPNLPPEEKAFKFIKDRFKEEFLKKALKNAEGVPTDVKVKLVSAMQHNMGEDEVQKNMDKIYLLPAEERPEVINALGKKGEKALPLLEKKLTKLKK